MDDYSATSAADATNANTGSLAIGGTASGTIEVAGDYDYFRIQLVAGTVYQFDLKGSSSGVGTLGDPTLMLHNAQNTALRYDDDGGRIYGGSSTDSQIVFIPQESGTYYLNAGGYASASGTYQLSAATLPSDYYLQAVLDQPNNRWNAGTPLGTPINVTYSFPTSVPVEYASYGENNFQPFTTAQKDAARLALADISHYANITFTEVPNAGGQIRFATTDQGSTSTGVTIPWTVGNALTLADVALSNGDPSNTSPTTGTFGYDTLVHEIGHALGLKHPGDYNAGGGGGSPPYLPTSQDASQFTIESYTGNATDSTYMVFDVAALQYLYGANTTAHAGNDNYTFSTSSIYTIWDTAGNDTLDASSWTTSVTMDLSPGAVSYAGYVGVDTTLTPCVAIAFNCTIENATGGSNSDKLLGNIGDNVLMGGAGNDRLDSGAGNDTLDGGTGTDVLIGGVGNDIYVVDVASDVITEVSGEGIDQVNVAFAAAGTYTLGANLENATVTSGATIAVNLTGNADNNVLTGNAAANTLTGGDGNDTLDGGAGADILDGGSGNDTLIGGAGTDTVNLSGNRSQYTLTATTTGWVLSGVDGADTLTDIESAHFSDQTISLGNFAPTGTVTISGTATQGQTLAAANTLADVDGLGAIGYQWQESTNGTAWVNINSVTGDTYTLTATEVSQHIRVVASYTDGHGTLESVTSSATVAVASLGNYINGTEYADTLIGTSGTDFIHAGGGDDTVNGGDGNDLLDGGAGVDTLTGGAGDNTYVINNIYDQVVEAASSGNDTVIADIHVDNLSIGLDKLFSIAGFSRRFTRPIVQTPNNVENLTLQNNSSAHVLGNSLDNRLTGNGEDNVLDGMDGNDILTGGGGHNTLTGGAGADTFVLDRVASMVASISDFNAAQNDKIGLTSNAYCGLFDNAGALRSGVYATGTQATTAQQRLLYDALSGALCYDSDGNGTLASVQVATLTNHSTLNANAFMLVAGN